MRKNFMVVAFVAAIALIAGINVYHAQKPVTLSDIAMENVEALAADEGNGIPWRGHVLDIKEQCCKYIAHPDAECSGVYRSC